MATNSTGTIRVNIPKVVSLDEAIDIYYSNIELSSEEIRRLFGDICNTSIYKLKALARERAKQDGVEVFSNSRVNTKVAYQVWGLDISDLEQRLQRKKKLGI